VIGFGQPPLFGLGWRTVRSGCVIDPVRINVEAIV
jgi:hypothetical protein